MKLKSNKRAFFSKAASSFKSLNPAKRSLVFMVAFGVIGAIIVIASQAAIHTFSVEPEGGNRNGDVSSESDASASGGSYLRFGKLPYTDIFVSPAGSDSKNGTTEANAVKTIAKAVQLANGHTRIRLMSGSYVGTFQIRKDNIIIEPYGNGDVTIIGSIPELVQGVSWTYVQPGIYKYSLNRDEYNWSGNPIYTSDGKQLWTYPDVLQLQNKFTVHQLPGGVVNNFILDRAVYIATPNGQPPTAPLYVGASMPTVYIQDATNIKFNGLSNSKLKIAYGSTNVGIKNSNNITLNNVEIIGGQTGVSAYDTSSLSITNSYLHGSFDRSWHYKDVKERPGTRTMENQAIYVNAQTKNISNIVIDSNHITGYWAAIHMPSPYASLNESDKHINENSVISNNHIHDIHGVSIEPEAPFKNLVIKGNRVYDTYEPISPTPAIVGPIYIFENLLVANRGMPFDESLTHGPGYSIKMNRSYTVPENVHFYHNTFYFVGDTNLRRTIESTPTMITKNVSFKNNIFHSTGGGILRGTGRAEDGIDFDGNVFYSEKNVPDNYYAWNSFLGNNSSFSSLNAIVSAGKMPSQWQANVEGNPGFNCIEPANTNCFKATAGITKPNSLQPLPSSFAESGRLNSRTRIGAFE